MEKMIGTDTDDLFDKSLLGKSSGYRHYTYRDVPVACSASFKHEQMMWKLFFVHWWFDKFEAHMYKHMPEIFKKKEGVDVTSKMIQENTTFDHLQFNKNGNIIIGWNTEKDTCCGTDKSILGLMANISKAGDGYDYMFALDPWKK